METEFRFDRFTPTPFERKHLDAGARTLAARAACFPRKHLHVNVSGHPRRSSFHLKVTLALPHRQLFTGEADQRTNFLGAWRLCLKKMQRKLEAYRQRLGGEDRGRWRLDAEEPHVPLDAADELARACAGGNLDAFLETLEGARPELARHARRIQGSRRNGRLPENEVVDRTLRLAFERFGERPRGIALLDWLHALVPQSLRETRTRRADRSGPSEGRADTRGIA